MAIMALEPGERVVWFSAVQAGRIGDGEIEKITKRDLLPMLVTFADQVLVAASSLIEKCSASGYSAELADAL